LSYGSRCGIGGHSHRLQQIQELLALPDEKSVGGKAAASRCRNTTSTRLLLGLISRDIDDEAGIRREISAGVRKRGPTIRGGAPAK
jgi:hypothetical protein